MMKYFQNIMILTVSINVFVLEGITNTNGL